ncbi:hypothetical protein MtrunA17_Chr3g0080121 [Medicago truncatula]|uniref:Transmembrane protein n=1 Tax=Medicago truncatula TaxID=3880 RepID=A0A396IL36_MEDTR|nr:hypothetical protein MtrunA17_Chr3g0080121 [Medicago truncatula]
MVGRSRLFDSDPVLISKISSESDASGNVCCFLSFVWLCSLVSFIWFLLDLELLGYLLYQLNAFGVWCVRWLLSGDLSPRFSFAACVVRCLGFLASGVVLFISGLGSSYCWDIEAWLCIWFLARMYTMYLAGGVVVFCVGHVMSLVLCWCCSSFMQLGGNFGVVP